MFGSSILDVAIGMAFIYLLLSLIASAFQEILASIIQARPANLQRGLRSLFSGDCFNTSTKLVDQIYAHGLIRGLYQDPTKDYGYNQPEPRWTESWRTFFGKIRLALRWLLRMSPPGQPSRVNDLLLPAYIPSRTFALALRDILNEPKPFGWDSMRNIEQNLSTLRQQYPDNKAVEALLALVVDAARKPETFQANLENWYNDAMDRVSGWYKRYVQNVLLFIGLGIAIIFNVNSVRVGQTLWVDKDARAGLTAAAGEYLKSHQGVVASSPSATPGALRSQLSSTVSDFEDVSRESLLPVGWRRPPSQYWNDFNTAFKRDRPTAIGQILLLLAGWIATAIALSLGAPFWFDTLNKFMVVRSTIKPQEKSQTEKSKDN